MAFTDIIRPAGHPRHRFLFPVLVKIAGVANIASTEAWSELLRCNSRPFPPQAETESGTPRLEVRRPGPEPHWVNAGGFGNIVPGLSSGRCDAALANLSVTPERLKQVDFVSHFNSNRLGLARLKKDAPPQPPSGLADLCGQTVGASSGTMNAATLRRQSEACQAAGPPAYRRCIAAGFPAPSPLEGLRYMIFVSWGTPA
ncbi:transporter substrate-binding domain-containing protein [Teichococcus oryzae]|uniref:transporter substrate-binding domain-containing protein n=1 Tax=Teichococcus oryzae TaxID=1608942 RepID=UPI0013761DED|nr:transporter substrate-binding domain-containing protein [Pseudoroseomonas oryzae]